MNKIFLVPHSQYRFLQVAICEELRSVHNSNITAYCSNEQEASFWRRYLGSAIDRLVMMDSLYHSRHLEAANLDELYARARSLEIWIETTLNEVVMTDRHYGRGYALTGFRHPRSYISDGSDYPSIVEAFCNRFDFWRLEFERHSPSLLISLGKVESIVARKFGVPQRAMVGSRFQNYFQWVENEFFENPRLLEKYASSDGNLEVELRAPYHSHSVQRAQFVRSLRVDRLLFNTIRMIAQRSYWRLRRFEKSKGYNPLSEIAYLWRRRRQLGEVRRLGRSLASLRDVKFVYYPLHTEPELSLQTLSPEYFYQLSCIAALSRDLPAGYVLAVKETFDAVGRRPLDFYKQLAEFKNVVLLDPMELGLDVVKAAQAVCVITGTAGFEAAVLGKPVISFGRHNQFSFLPHVRVVSNESDLKGYLSEFLCGERDVHSDAISGRRFLEAIVAVSFDLREYHFYRPEVFDRQVIFEAISSLKNSLGDGND